MADALSQLCHSQALWNRSHLDLESDETLAQLLDRGSVADWRALYALSRQDPELCLRIERVIRAVPLPLPHFWLAALSALGHVSAFTGPFPGYADASSP